MCMGSDRYYYYVAHITFRRTFGETVALLDVRDNEGRRFDEDARHPMGYMACAEESDSWGSFPKSFCHYTVCRQVSA